MSIIFVRSVIIYILVVIAVRIMGKRQIGELNPHELVITILISSVATVPLQDNSMPLTNSIIPILIFVALEVLGSALSMKSLWFRNLIQGKPIIIIKDGKLQQKDLKRLRFTIDDLMDSLRRQDVFDISQVAYAVVETNGNLTVQKKSAYMPLTSLDMNLPKQEAVMPITVVIDGKPVSEYFGSTKYSQTEIEKLVKGTGVDIKDILLMTVDVNSNTFYIKKENSEI